MSKLYSTATNLLLIAILITGCGEVKKSEVADSSYNPEARLKELNITLPSPLNL